MNKILLFLTIIIFLFKTENVLTNENIFYVDNIIVSNEKNLNKEQLLNIAVKMSFNKLINKILQSKDVASLSTIRIDEIKKLILNYQIIENNSIKDTNNATFNITFDTNKLRNFFYLRNFLYADIPKTSLIIYPVLLKGENFFLFSENYFYNNWNKKSINELIEYILPNENLDDIEFINKNKNNLESININKILSVYDVNDYIFLIIKPTKSKIEFFLKGIVSRKKIIKNICYYNMGDNEEINYQNSIKKIKKEIEEIFKIQNLIDVRTPSFLNIILDIDKGDDLLKLQLKLNEIDLIENYYVLELSKDYAKIKIKYLGKIDKMKKKLTKHGIDIEVSDNSWKLKLI